jgi:carbon-monoxide dehydrogenase large subunit
LQRAPEQVLIPRESPSLEKYVGTSVRRKEALPLLFGEGLYTDDIELPVKLYHAAFLRSTYAHARIRSIDSSKALKLKGVVSIFTGEDFRRYKMGYWNHLSTIRKPDRFPLAVGKVRYNGEPVALVIATDKYIAEDALDLISVDYEPLEAIVDPIKSLENNSTRVYEEYPDNIIASETYRTTENLIQEIEACPVVIKETLRNGRTSPAPLEPRTHLAYFNGDEFRIWSCSQCPHLVRAYLAEVFDLSENKIRIFSPNVGGSFGPKTNLYPDEVALYAASLELEAAIKWIETRTEDLLTSGHERDQIHNVMAGFTSQGKLVGVYDQVIADVGTGGVFWTELLQLARSTTCLPGPYKFSLYGFDVKGVATNKAPWSANVGFGRPPGTFVIERLMDIAALKLGLDPSEIRRNNLVDKNDFPYRNPAGVTYDSGDYVKGLDKLLEMMNYEKIREEQRELRKRGVYIGVGFSVYCETSASAMGWFQSRGYDLAAHEKAIVRVGPTGKVTIFTGVADQGQGQKTVFAQVAADELRVDINDVEVVLGDTSQTPYSAGTFNSRSTVVVSNAIILASQKLAEKILRIGAFLLKQDPTNLEMRDGVLKDKVGTGKEISLAEISKVAYREAFRLPPGELPYLEEIGLYEPPINRNFISYGWHGSVVRVDNELGSFKVEKYFIVDDAGVIINPLTAEGQIYAGVIGQGFLQTFRELKYDQNGILLSSTFLDYTPPNVLEIPSVFELTRMITPSPSPGGLKGIGEGGAQGTPACLINAISDAVSPFGVKVTRLPIDWGELWEAITKPSR